LGEHIAGFPRLCENAGFENGGVVSKVSRLGSGFEGHVEAKLPGGCSWKMEELGEVWDRRRMKMEYYKYLKGVLSVKGMDGGRGVIVESAQEIWTPPAH
jgi:hypothetical protein